MIQNLPWKVASDSHTHTHTNLSRSTSIKKKQERGQVVVRQKAKAVKRYRVCGSATSLQSRACVVLLERCAQWHCVHQVIKKSSFIHKTSIIHSNACTEAVRHVQVRHIQWWHGVMRELASNEFELKQSDVHSELAFHASSTISASARRAREVRSRFVYIMCRTRGNGDSFQRNPNKQSTLWVHD